MYLINFLHKICYLTGSEENTGTVEPAVWVAVTPLKLAGSLNKKVNSFLLIQKCYMNAGQQAKFITAIKKYS
jgi:hypothetical protein